MDIYREEILDHWRNPQNFGEIANADFIIEQVNPLCGDEVKFFFKFAKGRISDVSFTGNGCAISTASSSILSEFLKNKPLKVLTKISGKKIVEMLGGQIAPARLKCAFLPLEAIQKIRKNGV